MPTRTISQTIDLTNKPINKYITEITGGGIKVHDSDDILNYIQLTSDGMEIFKTNGAESNPSAVSVANFGEITRIGKKDDASIIISTNGIIGKGEMGAKFFNFTNSSATIPAGYSFSETFFTDDYPTTQETAYEIISDFTPTEIKIYSKLPFDQHNYSMGSFTPGVAVTRTRRFTIQSIVYTVSLYYDGDYTFKTWIDNHPLNSYKIYFLFQLTQTSIAPAFELGGGEATGGYALAEGYNTVASGNYSHAEGLKTKATNHYTHAEGELSKASGWWAHAEGYSTEATGNYACHVEGYDSIASGDTSHAEGFHTIASGSWSHTQNVYTVATEANQTVIGKYNAATVNWDNTNLDYTYTNVGNYAFIIGNGTSNTTAGRSNALTVDWSGNLELAGSLKTNRDVLSDSKTISITATGQTLNFCSLTLPANSKFLILTTVYTNRGTNLTLINHITCTNNATMVGANTRVTTSSGQGLANWYYVVTNDSSSVATLHGYSYPDGGTGYNQSGHMVAIPL